MGINEILGPYKARVEKSLREDLHSLGPKTALRDACEYAVLNGGKRFRPILVFMVADALGCQTDVTKAALAVEYFHTASLIADDFPCMDNDDMRRGKPALHKVAGESAALLATYALIAAGYERLAQNAQEIKGRLQLDGDRIGVLALENAAYNTGLLGATGGQYLDMFPQQLTKEFVLEIIRLKTVSLFEISFVLGWLYGGGNIELLDHVKKAAAHFGTAFQIADDIDDLAQDAKNEKAVNLAAVIGLQQAKEIFHEELHAFYKTLETIHLKGSPLEQMARCLNSV